MTKPWMAQITHRYLDKVPLFGKLMNVSPSEKEHVQRPKDDWLEVAELTKDYSGERLVAIWRCKVLFVCRVGIWAAV